MVRRALLVLAAVAVLIGAGVAAFLLLRGDDAGVGAEERLPERPEVGFEAGVQAGRLDRDVRMSAALAAPVARVEWDIATPAAELRPVVTAYAREGIRVQPLAGYEGRMPTRAEALNVGAWARAVGPEAAMWDDLDARLAVRDIEFGTETSYAYQGTQRRGGEYARRAREASEAAKPAGVGLFIQADDANQVDGWIDQMYRAVPDLHEYASAWIVHPYGPEWRRRLDWTIARTAKQGAPRLPIAVTEYGVANDGGRCLDKNYGWPQCLTSPQAAEILSGVVRDMRAEYPRVSQFIVYNNHDLRRPGRSRDAENYFGALRSDGTSKGAFTDTVKEILASK